MNKWTPGPWLAIVENKEYGGEFFGPCIQQENDGISVASIISDLDTEEVVANAALIASAPDLYASLNRCLDVLMGLKVSDGELGQIAFDATKALAKADGSDQGVVA